MSNPQVQFYKYLNTDGTTPQTGYQWLLPKGQRPGKWLPPIKGQLIACERGYHVMRASDLLEWSGPTCWAVEVRGDHVDHTDKIVVREARLLAQLNWNDRVARLFACDCAERALTHDPSPDPRSTNAIAVARKFANGEASRDELAAAWAAARDAAWDAAWDAARADARAAARAAARDAAWADERDWQIKRLTEYLHGELP